MPWPQATPKQVAAPVFQAPSAHTGVVLGLHPAGQLTVQMVPCATGAAMQAVGTDAPALSMVPGVQGAVGVGVERNAAQESKRYG